MLAEKFGGKFLFLFGVFWTALLTVLTPPITYAGGFGAIVATRILQGIGQVRCLCICINFYDVHYATIER